MFLLIVRRLDASATALPADDKTTISGTQAGKEVPTPDGAIERGQRRRRLPVRRQRAAVAEPPCEMSSAEVCLVDPKVSEVARPPALMSQWEEERIPSASKSFPRRLSQRY